MGEAGTVWPVRRAADNGQRDAGMQWRNKSAAEIAKLLLGRVMSDSGLRTACIGRPSPGWTKSKQS
ncbi:hypothetical protein BN2476_190015 [Paraburkholderia piptadeniae]|uniref:Uncharacterized protein n=1 Tax=Paraburkholderia piptadeniae TaxID=1701573 RepID=A0A1N7RUJ3_9BURK|nr:hypothetical protein BN2476_190015 [Paraburkholderia piptadeniae]